jgi:uncharacterized integral membrane protein
MSEKSRKKDSGKGEEVVIDGSLQRGKIRARVVTKWRGLSESKMCLILLFLMLLINLLALVISLVVSRKDVPSTVCSVVYAIAGLIICVCVSYVFVRQAQKILLIGLAELRDT